MTHTGATTRGRMHQHSHQELLAAAPVVLPKPWLAPYWSALAMASSICRQASQGNGTAKVLVNNGWTQVMKGAC